MQANPWHFAEIFGGASVISITFLEEAVRYNAFT
jgi:hypothetical protein